MAKKSLFSWFVLLALSEVHLADALPGLFYWLNAVALHPVVDGIGDGDVELLKTMQIIPQLHTESHIDDMGEHLLAIWREVVVVLGLSSLELGDVDCRLAIAHGLDRHIVRPLLQQELHHVVLGASVGQAHDTLLIAILMDEPFAQVTGKLEIDVHRLEKTGRCRGSLIREGVTASSTSLASKRIQKLP